MDMNSSNEGSKLRVLVAIASYGTSNDRYLDRIIQEYRSMAFAADIVLLSNIGKSVPGTECLVGLPSKNPWSLPFAHKKLFADRRDRYDLFIYSEDDILITEGNLRAWLEVNASLADDEIAGFLRFETGSNGERSYPDAHAHFHWDPGSVRRRGPHTLAHFTNEHAACYVLTRDQLRKVLNSGGFDVPPHEGKYDLLCTAATDPYTQCGFTKLIPVSLLDAFAVHHMSNRYVGKMGVTAEQFGSQIEAILRIAQKGEKPKSLLRTETRLWRCAYSKDYYEPVNEQVTSLIPKTARRLLSIGCGSGATERRLAQKGMAVTVIPLNSIICKSNSEDRIEVIEGDFQSTRARLDSRRFDCILLLNVLHLARDPVEILSAFRDLLDPGAPAIIQSPNMSNLAAIWSELRNRRIETPQTYEKDGAHFSFKKGIANWCDNAGLTIDKTVSLLHRRVEMYDGVIPAVARRAFASDIIAIAKRPVEPVQDIREARA